DLAGDGAVADVGVDLAFGRDADGHRLQLLGQVDLVGGDDHAAAGDLAADHFGVEVFAAGGELPLRRDWPRAGGPDLRHDSSSGQWSVVSGQWFFLTTDH